LRRHASYCQAIGTTFTNTDRHGGRISATEAAPPPPVESQAPVVAKAVATPPERVAVAPPRRSQLRFQLYRATGSAGCIRQRARFHRWWRHMENFSGGQNAVGPTYHDRRSERPG